VTDEPQETPEETATFFEAISTNPLPSGYTAMDAYRDFRKVMLGSDEGKRVFWQFLSRAHFFRSSIALRPGPIDTNDVLRNEGERNMGIWLLNMVTHEPQGERPTRANQRKGEA
jgi:hypothetical protein